MADILKVKDYAMLEALQNHTDGEIAYCEDTQKYYMYDEEWKPVNIENTNDGIQIGLYDLNRQIIEQLPPFTETNWAGAEKIFIDWEESSIHNYYMLYGKEVSYFTLFKKKKANGECNSLFEALKECLDNIGDVHSFDITEDKMAIEIWIKSEDVMTCMYFFNYDDGVVTFNE